MSEVSYYNNRDLVCTGTTFRRDFRCLFDVIIAPWCAFHSDVFLFQEEFALSGIRECRRRQNYPMVHSFRITSRVENVFGAGLIGLALLLHLCYRR